MRIKRLLVILLALDIFAIAGYYLIKINVQKLPFDMQQSEVGEYECSFLGVNGTLKIEKRFDDILLKTWTAENASLTLLESVPDIMNKHHEMIFDIPISQTWQDKEYIYVFSHAVTDSGTCDYKFVQYPISYPASPEEYMIDYAVAIDAE